MGHMDNIIEKAKQFALEKHGNQKHGCLNMSDHLEAVVGKLIDYQNKNEYDNGLEYTYECQQAIAWLHDVLEDTDTTEEELKVIFNYDIVDGVLRVTDGPGNTRTERHLNTYWRTRGNEDSVIVKLCDRWHNHQRSIDNKEIRFAKDYANEYIYFKFALYNGYETYLFPFWKELDVQHKQLCELLNDFSFNHGMYS